ncbi:hypothetical protein AERO8C_70328 [Aeromonas veronii]|uniref:Uncharacterized protein n=1 Tax=Aeromonas veronii TaxID=654 RepID=A0A653LBB9_AERVE|nr:hypothetical protein AERO8C_70328 [Aeromonas veronii]
MIAVLLQQTMPAFGLALLFLSRHPLHNQAGGMKTISEPRASPNHEQAQDPPCFRDT